MCPVVLNYIPIPFNLYRIYVASQSLVSPNGIQPRRLVPDQSVTMGESHVISGGGPCPGSPRRPWPTALSRRASRRRTTPGRTARLEADRTPPARHRSTAPAWEHPKPLLHVREPPAGVARSDGPCRFGLSAARHPVGVHRHGGLIVRSSSVPSFWLLPACGAYFLWSNASWPSSPPTVPNESEPVNRGWLSRITCHPRHREMTLLPRSRGCTQANSKGNSSLSLGAAYNSGFH